MKTIFAVLALALGWANPASAWAEPVGHSDAAPVISASQPSGLVVSRHHPARAPLTGNVASLVSGLTGAAVPLVVLVVPLFWIGSLGPFGFPLLAFAVIWGGVAVGSGGVVAWLISAAFSDMRSGFLIPVGLSVLVGVFGTLLSGALAIMVMLPAIMFGAYAAWGLNWNGEREWQNWSHNPLTGGAMFAGLCVWTVGLVLTAIAGPVTAAWAYRKYGVYKRDDNVHVDVMTP